MVKRNFSVNSNIRGRYGKSEVYRCVICNAVNRAEIATDEGDHYHYGYHEVEYGTSGVPAFVCHDCQGHHLDVMSEWEISDELDLEEGEEM